MKKTPFHLTNLIPFLPYLYFISLSLLMFIGEVNRFPAPKDFLLLIPAIPFALQLIFSFKYLDLILGVFTFALTCYLCLAYISDLADISALTTQALSFIVVGAAMLTLNFIMSILLFRNQRVRNNLSVV